jgi:hypothetical protein
MTRQEWKDIAGSLLAWWPHNQVPVASLLAWYEELMDLPAQQVAIAAKAICADGTPHMPNWAQIRNRVLDIATDAPDFSEVVQQIGRIAGKMPDRRYTTPEVYEARYAAVLERLHPLVASWIETVGWKHIRHSNLEDRIAYAQLRDTWAAHIKKRRQDYQLAEITGQILPQLKTVNNPTQLGGAA